MAQFRELLSPEATAAEILDWYDIHARDLPWRIGPADRAHGVLPDPYRVWLSEIMLQQTTVAAVKAYFERFTARWPEVSGLANAPLDDVLKEWAGLGYYARARNLHKCAQTVAHDFGGRFPETEADLLSLPGIGPYTAAAITSIAFDRRATVMDGNVERVVARLFAVEDPLPGAKKTLYLYANSLTPEKRPGDYAQAVMDLGATICTPRNPACGICPLMRLCKAREHGIETTLPRKTPKKSKPVHYGTAWIALREDGAVLLDRRPEKGLLGGMMEVPSSDWTEGGPEAAAEKTAPLRGPWQDSGEARHTFTHFHLILSVKRATGFTVAAIPSRGSWIAKDEVAGQALPTVMRKVLKAGGVL